MSNSSNVSFDTLVRLQSTIGQIQSQLSQIRYEGKDMGIPLNGNYQRHVDKMAVDVSTQIQRCSRR